MALLVACGSRQTSPNPSAGADRPSLTVLGTLTGSGNDELAAVFADRKSVV